MKKYPGWQSNPQVLGRWEDTGGGLGTVRAVEESGGCEERRGWSGGGEERQGVDGRDKEGAVRRDRKLTLVVKVERLAVDDGLRRGCEMTQNVDRGVKKGL